MAAPVVVALLFRDFFLGTDADGVDEERLPRLEVFDGVSEAFD